MTSIGAADSPGVDIVSFGTSSHDYTQGSYSLGWRFTAKTDLNVTSLGFYDDKKNGITGIHPVGIYDATSKQLLVSTSVSTADPLTGYFRYHALAKPFTLKGGADYVLQAVTLTDPYFYNLDLKTPDVVINPNITFVGAAIYYANSSATDLHYPDTIDPTALADFGPNMLINAGAATAGPPTISLSNSTFLDSSPAGTPIGTLSTSGSGTTFRYTLVPGANADDNALFAISGAALNTAASFNSAVQNSFSIRIRSTDQSGTILEKTFALSTYPALSSGIPNVSNNGGTPAVTNPVDGFTIKVLSSSGGAIQLGIDVNSLLRAQFAVSTDFGDTSGKGSTAPVKGLAPNHQYVAHGIYVATSTATDVASNTQFGKGRKTLVIGSKETGEVPPTTVSPPSNAIALRSIKGKFTFTATTADTVLFSGTIKLPAKFDPFAPHPVSIALGNVVVVANVDAKGKGTELSTRGALKSLKIAYKVKKGNVAIGGEDASIVIQFSTPGLVKAGFDTEGIAVPVPLTASKMGMARSIQIGLLLDGVPYESLAPVTFSVSSTGDFGVISGRTKKN